MSVAGGLNPYIGTSSRDLSTSFSGIVASTIRRVASRPPAFAPMLLTGVLGGALRMKNQE
jgi:hypothetical protein